MQQTTHRVARPHREGDKSLTCRPVSRGQGVAASAAGAEAEQTPLVLFGLCSPGSRATRNRPYPTVAPHSQTVLHFARPHGEKLPIAKPSFSLLVFIAKCTGRGVWMRWTRGRAPFVFAVRSYFGDGNNRRIGCSSYLSAQVGEEKFIAPQNKVQQSEELWGILPYDNQYNP